MALINIGKPYKIDINCLQTISNYFKEFYLDDKILNKLLEFVTLILSYVFEREISIEKKRICENSCLVKKKIFYSVLKW